MIPLLRLTADPGDPDLLDRVARHLDGGGLVAYPTETVYGLGARADADGVAGVRDLKGRAEEKPFLVLLPGDGEGDAESGVEGDPGAGLSWGPSARDLARAFWPGPLTLVLEDPRGLFPPGVRGPGGGVAIRRSPEPFVEALLRRWPHPLISTSANRAGDAPARDADQVIRAVEGRPGLHRLWILDGGPRVEQAPSTVLDCTREPPRIIRAGALSPEALREVVPEVEEV